MLPVSVPVVRLFDYNIVRNDKQILSTVSKRPSIELTNQANKPAQQTASDASNEWTNDRTME